MKHELWEIEVTWNALISIARPFLFSLSRFFFLLTLWVSVEYDFRQQERRFKELFQSLCPPSPERREGYEESLSLLALLIQNHKLHQLNANIMSRSQTQSQPQIISQIQCQIQAHSQIQTHSQSQIPSRPQAQPQIVSRIQPHSQIQIPPQIQSQNEIISQIKSQTEIMPPLLPPIQIMPQIQSQTHPENQCLFKAKIKRKKLCRKLFGWLPHKVQRKWLHHAKYLIFMHDSQPSGMRSHSSFWS